MKSTVEAFIQFFKLLETFLKMAVFANDGFRWQATKSASL